MSNNARKGACEVTPPNIPEPFKITRAIMAQLLQIVVRIGAGQVGNEEVSDVSVSKLTAGILDDDGGEKVMQFDGEGVVLRSANFQKDERRLIAPLVSNLSNILTIPDARFTGQDVGRTIVGDGVDTTIAAVNSPEQIRLTANPTGPGVDVVLYMAERPAGAGWALYGDGTMEVNAGGVFRGKLELAGFTAEEDGSVVIGVGESKMTAHPDGSFTWGKQGAVVGITPDGELFAGGEDKTTALFLVDNAGNVTVKETAQSMHSIPASSLDWTVLPPTFDPAGGAFNDTIEVAILCQTPGVTIYYTTDGSTPDDTKTLYTGARISIAATTTLKAIAILAGLVSSSVATQTFTQDDAVVPNPTADPVGGDYSPLGGNLNVDLSCSLAGASMRYTTNGSTPSEVTGTLISPPNGSTVPTGTVQLAAGTRTLKVIAFKSGKTNSGVVTNVYEITSGGGGTGGGGGGGRGNVP